MFPALFAILALAVSFAYSATYTGCGSQGFSLDVNRKTTRKLPSGRQYLLHVPKGYSADTATPMVISFHGANGNSATQETLSQFSEAGKLINGLPIIGAYPQGAASASKSSAWYSAPYANTTVDDVQFAKDIVTDIANNYCIDQSRVYATGKSNGGGFTAYLACRPDTSLLFAAFATVSAALYPGTLAFSGCNPSRAVPIINSHGLVDETIPYLGRNDSSGQAGVGTATINLPLWRRQWAVRNGCASAEGSLPNPGSVTTPYVNATEELWTCGNATIEALTVSNLGHSWPTVRGLDGSGAPQNMASFNLTDPSILSFFSANALPKAYIS